MGASARFSAPLSRARSPVNARAWRGREGGDVSSSRAKLVLCLGSQILNFHSRARTRFGRPLFFLISPGTGRHRISANFFPVSQKSWPKSVNFFLQPPKKQKIPPSKVVQFYKTFIFALEVLRIKRRIYQ